MKERLERALRIALDRAKQEMRALMARADNPPVIALALDRMAAEIGHPAEPNQALNAFDRHIGLEQLASWADIQRLLNALEAAEEAEGIEHVSISAHGGILASTNNQNFREGQVGPSSPSPGERTMTRPSWPWPGSLAMRKRLTKAQLYEKAKKTFFAFHVYKNPDGPGWIAHGIHREYRSIWAATGETERQAIENLLFAKE